MDEVRCPAVKSVFFAILSVASVIPVGPVVEYIGPVVKVGPCVTEPVLEATKSVL